MRSFRFPAMGTEVHVLLSEDAPGAIGLVRDLFASWEETLSRFGPESELSRLNARAGEGVLVSELLFEVVTAAVDAAAETDGAFDPTLVRQLVHIGYDRPFARLPITSAPATRPIEPGGAWRRIVLDPRSRAVRLPAGCGLDLGGIAKGMAVDAALDALGRRGVSAALISAGGDLAVRGLPPGATSWAVSVGEAANQVVPLVRGALATSGIARRTWRQGDVRRHHLLDPRTGTPTENGTREVTVAAATCRQAEVGATAAFVLGPAAGASFLRDRRLAGRITRDDGRHSYVGRWPSPVEVAA